MIATLDQVSPFSAFIIFFSPPRGAFMPSRSAAPSFHIKGYKIIHGRKSIKKGTGTTAKSYEMTLFKHAHDGLVFRIRKVADGHQGTGDLIYLKKAEKRGEIKPKGKMFSCEVAFQTPEKQAYFVMLNGEEDTLDEILSVISTVQRGEHMNAVPLAVAGPSLLPLSAAKSKKRRRSTDAVAAEPGDDGISKRCSGDGPFETPLSMKMKRLHRGRAIGPEPPATKPSPPRGEADNDHMSFESSYPSLSAQLSSPSRRGTKAPRNSVSVFPDVINIADTKSSGSGSSSPPRSRQHGRSNQTVVSPEARTPPKAGSDVPQCIKVARRSNHPNWLVQRGTNRSVKMLLQGSGAVKKRLDDTSTTSAGRENGDSGSNRVKHPRPGNHFFSSGTTMARSFGIKHGDPALLPSLGGGILNLGNTCYMNSVMQAMYGLSGFVHDLRRQCIVDAVQAAEQASQSSDKKGVVNELRLFHGMFHFFRGLQQAMQRQETMNPKKNLRSAVCEVFPHFANTRQQDAHEFFVDITNRLHTELVTVRVNGNKEVFKPKPSIATTTGPDKVDRNFELLPTTRSFHIEIMTTLTCCKCRMKREKLELFRNLSVTFPPTGGATKRLTPLSVQDALGLYFVDETVEIQCERCECSYSTKTSSIHALPRVLVLHVKRFEAVGYTGNYVKRHDPIDVLDTIDLRPYCTTDVRNCPNDDLGPIVPLQSVKVPATTPISDMEDQKREASPGKKLSKVQKALLEQREANAAREKREALRQGGDRGYGQPSVSCGSSPSTPRRPAVGQIESGIQRAIENSLRDQTEKSEAMTPSQMLRVDNVVIDADASSPLLIKTTTPKLVAVDRVDFLSPISSRQAGMAAKTVYNLASIVHHIGRHAFSGHYVADVKQTGHKGTWYRFDDSYVCKRQAEMDIADRRNAYMVFYVLQDANHECSPEHTQSGPCVISV